MDRCGISTVMPVAKVPQKVKFGMLVLERYTRLRVLAEKREDIGLWPEEIEYGFHDTGVRAKYGIKGLFPG
jgi:hypothetical protein